MTTYEPGAGSIVHIELYSDDVDASRRFLGSVFGWEFEEFPEMDYTTWRAPNAPGGGLMAVEEGMEAFPRTLLYVSAESLDDVREAARAAGGSVVEAEIEVPEMGVFSILSDPAGVVTAAWEDRSGGEAPEEGWPALTDDPDPGSVTHFELYSEDTNATGSFVEAVYGWAVEAMEDGGYIMVRPPTPPAGGLMAATDEMPTGSIAYLLVEDAAETCTSSEAAGGTVLRDPFEIEGWGTMAVVEVPGGIPIALWEAVPAADPTEGPPESARN